MSNQKTTWEQFQDMKKNRKEEYREDGTWKGCGDSINFDEESDLMQYDPEEADFENDYNLEGMMQ